MSNPVFCAHYEHEHVIDRDGTWCSNCDKMLTVFETLDPNQRWTITNDGKGNLTIEY